MIRIAGIFILVVATIAIVAQPEVEVQAAAGGMILPGIEELLGMALGAVFGIFLFVAKPFHPGNFQSRKKAERALSQREVFEMLPEEVRQAFRDIVVFD